MAAGAVARVVLVNAATDKDIGTFVSGSTLNLSAIGSQLSVRAETSPAVVGSVRFAVDGATKRVETYAPYSIAGESGTTAGGGPNYNPWTPAAGSHTLVVTPFAGANATGAAGTPATVKFTVTGTAPAGTGRASADKATLYFNDPVGGARGPAVGLTIRNVGTGSLRVTGLSITGANAAQFVVASNPGGGALPVTLAAGGSAKLSVAFDPPAGSAAGLKTATLNIATNDPSRPTLSVPLRALATLGTGGQLEPSLQRIFGLYGITSGTGDTNPASTYLFSGAEPRAANDEVAAQLLKKAGSGPVTIQALATFAGGSPAAVVGWYGAGNPAGKKQLFTVSGSTAQSVNPLLSGTTSFDPGAGSFGLYTAFPFLGTTQHSQDALNTAERTIKRKIRFFALRQNGAVVPNAYVFTTEDWNNDGKGGTDSNDFVGIIRNVRVA